MEEEPVRSALVFRLRRFSGFFKTLLGNRMATVGLLVLIISTFIALAAPALTPYQPQSQQVAGVRAQPEWVTLFPDGYRLSKDLVAVKDPLFTSPAAVQALTISPSTTTAPNLIVSYAPNIFDRSAGITGTRGSLLMTYTGLGLGSVVVSQTFNFPYYGPPERFIASISFYTTGANSSLPVHVRVFISRVGDQVFNLWDSNVAVNTGKWVQPNYPLESKNDALKSFLGVSQEALGPADIIFSASQDYSYGVEVTFNGPQQVHIDNFQLNLLGTAWGVLGTDAEGVDLLSQVFYGARISLLVGLLSAFIGIGLGLVVGLMAGFLGKIVDEVLMRFTDMMLVIPGLPLLLVLVAVLGASIINIIIVIGFLGWMGFARIVRSQVLSLRERPFIEAAKAAGAGPMRIMFGHVFPNIVSLTYVNLALSVPSAILTETALEFLGLGDPSVISWGHMFFNAEQTGSLYLWWWTIPPGLAIALVSLSFVLIGYALDELFNPKLRRRR